MIKTSVYLLLFFCSNVFAHEQAEDYRSNPFQFRLPEYKYKATPIQIDSISKPSANYKTVMYDNYTFFLPKSFSFQKEDGMSTWLIRDKNKKGLFFISTNPSDFLLCGDSSIEKDYCSVFNTRKELLFKTFTLTPEDLAKPEYMSKGYSWIVFYKGIHFKYVSDIKIYERDGFSFFREDIKPDAPMNSLKVNLRIVSPKDDELIDVSFVVKDEKLIMDFIKSFKVIN